MTDDLTERMYNENPLFKFSLYTSVQATIIVNVGNEILEVFSQTRAGKVVFDFHNLYGKFWLWVLGAYEVVRTMSEYNECFVKEFQQKITQIKSKLATIRIPFAKQELKGTKRAKSIHAELSVSGFGPNQDTMLFKIEGQMVSAADLVSDVIAFFKSVKKEMIIGSIRVGLQH